MENILEGKYLKRAEITAQILKFVPFVRMIAINGSLANGKITKNSDIDFFIITEKNRLWFIRLLVTIVLDLCFLRAKKNKHRGKICLNHFLTNENYLLSRQDYYNAYQYSNLIVLYSAADTYQEFIKNNSWMNKFCQPINKTEIPLVKNQLVRIFFEKVLSRKIGNYFERKSRIWQIKKINHNPFFQQKDSALKISRQEFYYYTQVNRKYQLWEKSVKKS